MGTYSICGTNGSEIDYTSREPWFSIQDQFPKISFVSLNQTHSNLIHEVGKPIAPFINLGEGDGLTTTETGVGLTIRTADCMPVWIRDSQRLTLLHVGYQGLAKGILEKGLSYHCGDDVTVMLGVHIRSCCLEIRQDIIDLFSAYTGSMDGGILHRGGKTWLDMSQIVKNTLRAYGIHNILEHPECSCHQGWYSYRRNRTPLRMGHLAYRAWPLILSD
jgi:YfiH family protein